MNGSGQLTEAGQELATGTSRAGHRGTARALAALAAAVVTVLLAVSPAQAVNDNAPNLTVAGYGVSVGADVSCDPATNTLTVSARTSTMQASGLYGPIAGPYDSGQFVRYNVWARNADGGEWTQIYSWSPWQWISTTGSTDMVERLSIPAELGTNVVNGSPGNNYEAMVQIDWWTGTDNVANITPEYTQGYSTDPFNTYQFHPSHCAF